MKTFARILLASALAYSVHGGSYSKSKVIPHEFSAETVRSEQNPSGTAEPILDSSRTLDSRSESFIDEQLLNNQENELLSAGTTFDTLPVPIQQGIIHSTLKTPRDMARALEVSMPWKEIASTHQHFPLHANVRWKAIKSFSQRKRRFNPAPDLSFDSVRAFDDAWDANTFIYLEKYHADSVDALTALRDKVRPIPGATLSPEGHWIIPETSVHDPDGTMTANSILVKEGNLSIEGTTLNDFGIAQSAGGYLELKFAGRRLPCEILMSKYLDGQIRMISQYASILVPGPDGSHAGTTRLVNRAVIFYQKSADEPIKGICAVEFDDNIE